ncbi:MAG TPA: sigma-70 family RNA polymerase sigma factor [Candidatus Limnocylindrales bacterium]|jgi:RNA polymerase sigma factor (sigma-70 family)|nr:sigma-70 family RNA polymerase sigma factor [Candidatus Limnocylindrales bacterium]
MKDSRELLAEFARTGSDAGFQALVTRYVNLVYSAAVRMTDGDTHLAEDITQTVFADLARMAGSLRPEVMVGGWLHRHTCFVASNILRGERRRQARERKAAEMNALEQHQNMALDEVAPILDEAINQLGAEERTALLLRFFEQLDFRSVGEALGTTDEAAKKRVSRALDKLHRLLVARGLTLSVSALAAGLTAEAVVAAPAGLVATLGAAALTNSAITQGTALSLLKAMTVYKFSMAVAGAIIVASIILSVKQHNARTALAGENSSLQGQLDQSNTRIDDLSNQLAQAAANTLTTSSDQLQELLRLRGEVTGLRRDAARVSSLESELAKLRREATEEVPQGASRLIINNPYLARNTWSDKGTDSPYHAFETMLWAGSTGNTQRLAEVTIPGEHSILPIEHPPIRTVKGVQIVSVEGNPTGVTRIGAIVEDVFYGGGLNAPPGTVQTTHSWYLVQTNGEWKCTGQQAFFW